MRKKTLVSRTHVADITCLCYILLITSQATFVFMCSAPLLSCCSRRMSLYFIFSISSIILETDPSNIVNRVHMRADGESSTQHTLTSLSEQGFSAVGIPPSAGPPHPPSPILFYWISPTFLLQAQPFACWSRDTNLKFTVLFYACRDSHP